MTASKKIHYAILVLAVVALFGQTLGHGFFVIDDLTYVRENPNVRAGLSPASVRWAFGADLLFNSPHADYWQPITFLSRMADVELFGPNPAGHHFTSVLIHLLNTLLLFSFLSNLPQGIFREENKRNHWAFWVALLFAIHPLQVEAAAWITARKDLLGTFFALCGFHFYAAYVKKPSVKRYALLAAAFTLSLMSKPMLLTFPFLLLVLDYGLLNRRETTTLRTVVLEKIPLIFIAAAFACLKFLSPTTAFFEIPLRSVAASLPGMYVWYVSKVFIPTRLALRSPHFSEVVTWFQILASLLVLIVVSYGAWKLRKKEKLIWAGWLWFLISLSPMAILMLPQDRFMYVPIIGVFMAVVGILNGLTSRFPRTNALFSAVLVAAVFFLGLGTFKQTARWKDSITFLRHSAAEEEGNYLAEYNFGVALAEQKEWDEAIRHYEEALKINPNHPLYLHAIGQAFMEKGDVQNALAYMKKALEADPSLLDAQLSLGLFLIRQDRKEEAKNMFLKAVDAHPLDPRPFNNLGYLFEEEGKMVEAETYYRKAVEVGPLYAEAHSNLGLLLARGGREEEAMACFREAIRANPEYANAHFSYAIALERMGRGEEADRHYREALRLKPELKKAFS